MRTGLLVLGLAVALAGCSIPNSPTTQNIEASLQGNGTDFYESGATFEFSGVIYDEPGARIEVGAFSLDSIVVDAPTPVIATPSPAEPTKFTFAPFKATFKGSPGLHVFWLWYAAYDEGFTMPSRVSQQRFYITGDSDNAIFHGTEKPLEGSQTYTGTVGGLGSDLGSMLDVRAGVNHSRYTATFHNNLGFDVSGWLFASFRDYNAPEHQLGELEPTQIQPFNLAAGQEVRIEFLRPAWANESNRATDAIVVKFEPKYTIGAISDTFKLTRGNNSEPAIEN